MHLTIQSLIVIWPSWLKTATKIAIGVTIIAACAVATVVTGGASAGVAGYIASATLKGSIIGAVTGTIVGATKSVVRQHTTTGSWNGAVNAAIEGGSTGFAGGASLGAAGGVISGGASVINAARKWDKGGTYNSGYQSMTDHYNRQVIQKGHTNGNNIVRYTNDAIEFANRNQQVLQFTKPTRETMIPAFRSPYSKGNPGGWFTRIGRILTFWYK